MVLPKVFLQNTIKEIIKKYDLDATKSLGQNFIINPSLTRKIVSQIGDIDGKIILEVGSGPGCLTMAILEKDIKKLVIVEKDQKFSALLKEISAEDKVVVIFSDILDLDFGKNFDEKIIIISNLPYNISTPFLVKACVNYQYISLMALMFQKEVAERIVAMPGSKKYGRLSVMAQSFFDVKKILNVNASAFVPQPKVQSSVLLFKVNKKIPDDISCDDLSKVTQLLFSQRRKKISTILSSFANLDKLNLDLNLRPDHLELSDFYMLSRFISK